MYVCVIICTVDFDSRFPLSVPMYALIFKTTQRVLLRLFLIARVTQEEGLYVYKMRHVIEKHLVSALKPCEPGRVIISLLMSSLLGHRPSLWITHKENRPLPTTR
jgi:hypothetical protein